jgi:hypothetical protein
MDHLLLSGPHTAVNTYFFPKVARETVAPIMITNSREERPGDFVNLNDSEGVGRAD